MVRLFPLVAAALLLCGCHLIFPFDAGPTHGQDAAADQGRADLADGAPPRDTSAESPGPLDGPLAEQPPDQMPPDQQPPDTQVTTDLAAPDGGVPTPTHSWSKAFGGSQADAGNALAMDAAGNIYVAGWYWGGVNLGGPQLPNSVSAEAFVASYTKDGVHRWSKGFASGGADRAYGVAVDAAGTLVVVTGEVGAGLDLGAGMEPHLGGASDVFIVALKAATGKYLWSQRLGGSSDETGRAVAIHGGNVYVAGNFSGTTNLGGPNLQSGGSTDVFLAKWSVSGSYGWSQRMGGPTGEVVGDLTADSAGNLYLTGRCGGGANFGSSLLPNKGLADIYFASYNSSGAHRWSKSFGSKDNDAGLALAADSAGGVYLAGYATGTIVFGATSLPGKGGTDAFLARFTTSGALSWARGFASAAADHAQGVAVDASDNVYLTGLFEPPLSFGGGPIAGNPSDLFVASFAKSGSHRWSLGFGSTAVDSGLDLAAGSHGVFVTGTIGGATKLGGLTTLGGFGQTDIFLLRLLP